jgi:hypothetical protein
MSRPVPLFAITTASKITGKMVDRRTGRRADRYSRLPVRWSGSGRPRPAHQRPPQA